MLRHNATRDNTEFAQSEICGKSIYPTESDARRVMLSRKRHGAGFLRPYFCDRCKSYHITSSRHQKCRSLVILNTKLHPANPKRR